MISKPPPFKGLNMRIPSITPSKGKGVHKSRVWVTKRRPANLALSMRFKSAANTYLLTASRLSFPQACSSINIQQHAYLHALALQILENYSKCNCLSLQLGRFSLAAAAASSSRSRIPISFGTASGALSNDRTAEISKNQQCDTVGY